MGRGYNPYPNAYLYRDWVIKAFNDDLPYDQFVQGAAGRRSARTTKTRVAHAAGARVPRARALVLRQRRGRDHARRRAPRPRRRRLARLSRADRRLRPLPRSQVRSDSDEGLLLAGRRVPRTRAYHEYPLAPKSVVDEYKAQEKKIEKKEKLLGDFMRHRERRSWPRRWRCRRRSTWWPRGRSPASRRTSRRRSSTREARLRAVRALAEVPGQAAEVLSVPAPSGRRWSRAAASLPEAKKLADEFQDAAARRDVRQQGRQGRERHHRRQGAAGHQEEGAGEAAERVRHQRRLLSRAAASS